MPVSLDFDAEGGKWLPWAHNLLHALHYVLEAQGMRWGQKWYLTPDGSGLIQLRCRIMNGEWYDDVRITSVSTGGYIIRPYVKRVSTGLQVSLPAAYRFALIPWAEDKITAITTYNRFANTPHHDPASKTYQTIVTAVDPVESGILDGVIEGGKFNPNGYFFGLQPVGVFKHKYGDAQVKYLSVFGTGSISDWSDNTQLTNGGTAISGVNGLCTYTTNASGSAMVMEFEINTPGVFPKKYFRTINFLGSPQVTTSQITQGTNTGSGSYSHVKTIAPTDNTATWDELIFTQANYQSFHAEWTTSQTGSWDLLYPIAHGVNAAGSLVTIDARFYGSYTGNSSFIQDGIVPQGAQNVYPITMSMSSTRSSSGQQYMDLVLPGGATKTFDLSAASSLWGGDNTHGDYCGLRTHTGECTRLFTNTGVYTLQSLSGARDSTLDTGEVSVIYADASVPVVVYMYARYFRSFVTTGTDEGSLWVTYDEITKPTLTLGIMFADGDYTLTTIEGAENTIGHVENFNAAIDPVQGTGSITQLLNYPLTLYRPLRRIHTQFPVWTAPLNGYCCVDIKNSKDWLVAFYFPLTIDGAANPDPFQVFGSRLTTQSKISSLKTAFMDYLSTALATADPTAAADIAAGSLSNYIIKLHTDAAANNPDVASFV